ncbi:uncharacterized protein LOC127093903 [Lathyrus oleraceus]|uniref:uncharacterized protein LOC127093903 n=1 Tax=Pisum sativum TaxID=3888 RepID=UPI0021D204AC|nr:uncharacterized protein LOC127093903 [Pisum sativum]
MVHPDFFPQQVVSSNVHGVVVKAVDIGNLFKNEQEFECCDQMFQWIRMETSKLGFIVVIRRSDNGLDRICALVTMTCEKRGKYRTPLQNLKRDDTSSRICECPFKMCGYIKASVVADVLSRKSLHMSLLMVQELELIEQLSDMSLMCEETPSIVKLGMLKMISGILEEIRE